MATGDFPIWDRRNEDQQDRLTYYRDVLNNKMPELMQVIQLDDLWPHLRSDKVLNGTTEQRLRGGVVEEDMVNNLLDYITKQPVWRFHGLMRALHLTGQDHVIRLLGLNPDDYEDMSHGKLDLRDNIAEALRKALQSGEKRTYYQCRLMLVGHHAAGKTNLKYTLLNQDFKDEHVPTNHIDADPSEAKVSIEKTTNWIQKEESMEDRIAEAVALRLTEEAPKEDMTHDNDGVLAGGIDLELVTRMEEKYVPNVTELVTKGRADTKDQKQEMKIELFLWDFGGQSVFYTVHHAFLSHRGIYILVIDLSLDIKAPVKTKRKNQDGEEVDDECCPQTVEAFVDYWLSSIHMHMTKNKQQSVGSGDATDLSYLRPPCSPPVIIVGTHKDESSSEGRTKLEKGIWELLKWKPYWNQVYKKFFFMSNKERSHEEINDLKRTIEVLTKDQGMLIPLKWFQLKEMVCENATNGSYVIPFATAHDAGTKLNMDEEEIKSALGFFNDIGDVVYLNEGLLKDSVITNAQWLINQIKHVITIPRYYGNMEDGYKYWPLLEQKGCLHEKIVEYCWGEHRELIAGLMQKLGLLILMPSNYKVDSPFEPGEFFIVPSLLQPRKKGIPESPKTLKIEFDFIPLGFTSRLIAGLVNGCGWKVANEVFRDHAVLYSNEELDIRITIQEAGKHIYVSAKRTEEHVGSCKRVLADIKKQLKTITASGRCAPTIKVLCTHEKCLSNSGSSIVPIDIGRDFRKRICCPNCQDPFLTSDHKMWFDQDLHPEEVDRTENDRTTDAHPVLWKCNHRGGQESVALSNEWKNTLNSKRTELLKILRPSHMLEQLQQLGVVELAEKNELKLNATDEQQASRLVDYLEKGPVWKLHAFFRACVLDKQEPILKLLSVNPDKYKLEGDV